MIERLDRRTDFRLGNRNAEAHDVRSEGELILIRLRQGDYFKTACDRAGVPYSTAKRWLRLGRVGEGGTWGNYVCREEHVWFYEMVKYTLAELEGLAVDHWMQAIKDGNWQAARDFLARRFPRRWGLSVRRDPDLSGEAPAEVDLICGEDDPTPSGEPDNTIQQAAPPDLISPESVDSALAQTPDTPLPLAQIEPISAQLSKAATPARTVEAAPPILPCGFTARTRLMPLEPRFLVEAVRSTALLANLTLPLARTRFCAFLQSKHVGTPFLASVWGTSRVIFSGSLAKRGFPL